MRKIDFVWKGRKVHGAVAVSDGVAWFSVDGEVWTRPLEERSASRSRGTAKGGLGDPKSIVSPMPGKIIKVMKAKGDPVVAGEVVVVMEAMKMEYTLKSSINGEIEEIDSQCRAGEQVSLGAKLVRIKA